MKTILVAAFVIFVSISTVDAQDSVDIKRLETAADWGDSEAAYQLGMAYDTGVGVSQDYTKADFWYSQAASHGNKKAADRRIIIKDAVQRSMSEYALTHPAPSRYANGKANKLGVVLDSMPTSQQPASETSTWNKAKEFVSEHTDDITEIVTFVLEKYVPGLQPSEGTTKNSGESAKPSK